MKISDLKDRMVVQTTHARYGFVEEKKRRICICHNPGMFKDRDVNIQYISFDELIECDGTICVGHILTQEQKDKYPSLYEFYEVGDVVVFYEFVAVYDLKPIYFNGEGSYPNLKLKEDTIIDKIIFAFKKNAINLLLKL